MIEALGIWGQRWSRRELAKHEINLSLLMWGLERTTKPEAFGARRCVVKLTFADRRKGGRHWWFVNEDGRAELCIKDPGFEVDLYLRTTLPDMIYLYRGDLPLARALAQGRLEAHGAAWARRALARWLAPSLLAQVNSQRADARAA